MFGVDQLFIDMYLEDTTPATDQFHIDIIEDLSEFSFQTGSLWQVVSLDTILDRHFHLSPHEMEPTRGSAPPIDSTFLDTTAPIPGRPLFSGEKIVGNVLE